MAEDKTEDKPDEKNEIEDPEQAKLLEENFAEVMEAQRAQLLSDNADDPVSIIEKVYQIWWNWADFHIFIVSPTIQTISPPLVLPAEHLPDSNEYEFVYPILDHGFKLSTSKASEMFVAGKSMCKMFYTIEKMIFLLVERLKSGGVSSETEVQIAFAGHELAQRKGFESIINLNYNVVVTNFDPGTWGQRYLEIVKRFAEKGYGYLPEAPRDVYRLPRTSSGPSRQS